MTVSRRASAFLIVGFGAILACMLGALYIGVQHLEVTRQAWLRDAAFREKVRAAFVMREAVRERSFRLAFATTFPDFFDRDSQQEHFREAASVFVRARGELQNLILTPEEADALRSLEGTITKARPVVDEAMARVVEGGGNGEIQAQVEAGLNGQSKIIESLNTFVKVVEDSSLREAAAASRAVEQTQRKMMGLSTGAVILAIVIGIFVVARESRTTRELAANRDMLAKLSTTDALTGIANRRRFDEVFELEWTRAMRSGAPLSLILIDVDHFKWYNDEYGHAMGDQCLAAVAKAMSALVVRATDLAARYGGEEFACVLSNTDNAGALVVAEKIREAVAALEVEHKKSSAADHVTISIGVATVRPSKMDNPKDFFERADQCLYKAKESGRNRVVGCLA
ncbi:MAG: diguanylate cyclase [Magnetospirillum sp. WYHS-4]